MTTPLVLDTHALIWYMGASSRLSAVAQSAIQSAIQTGMPVYVSAVSMVEIAYLSEKKRLPAELFDQISRALKPGDHGLVEMPFTVAMAETLRTIPATVVPELPDRMIAATALHLNLPLVTCDHEIRAASMVVTIW